MKDKSGLILNLLKKEELSTSKIAYAISSNQYRAEELLEELKKENKIEKRQGKSGVYWRLKMKTHNKFIEKVIKESKEPTLAEQTHDALRDKQVGEVE